MQDPCPVGLRGIVPSLNRPFTEDDAADIDHVRRLLDWTVEAGSAGMLILAVAGEGQSLAREEFRAFAATVVDHNAGRIPVILSVTSAVRRSDRRLLEPAHRCQHPLLQAPASRRGIVFDRELPQAGPTAR